LINVVSVFAGCSDQERAALFRVHIDRYGSQNVVIVGGFRASAFLAHGRRFGIGKLIVLAAAIDASAVAPRLVDGVAGDGSVLGSLGSLGSATGTVLAVVDANALWWQAPVLRAALAGGCRPLLHQPPEGGALRCRRAIVRVALANDGRAAARRVAHMPLHLAGEALVSDALLGFALDVAVRIAVALHAAIFRLPRFSCSTRYND